MTPNLNHKSSCPITDVTIPHDSDCTCGAVLGHRTDIIRDCQAILTDYLVPDGIDAPTAINRLLEILDGPRGCAAVGILPPTDH
jgi:hypothetical protein